MRRANNEGSITRYKNKYRAFVSIGYDSETGKPIRRSKVLPTKEECLIWIHDMKKKYGATARDRFVTNPATPVRTYFTNWFDIYVGPTVKESTHYSYRSLYDIHIDPILGDVPLKNVTTDLIQHLCVSKLKSGLSTRTVHLILHVLSSGLDQAVEGGTLPSNPAKGVKLPVYELPKRPHLTVEQARELLEMVRGHRFYLGYVLALTHGMRRGEILGLTWSNIDLKNRTISIKNSLSRVRKVDPKEGENITELVLGKPKTKYSEREIPMSEHAYEHFLHTKEMQESMGINSDFVLSTSNGTPTSPDNLSRYHRKVRAKLDLPNIRFHDLRHTFATLAGEPPISGNQYVIKAILGHTEKDITAHYTHSTLKSMRALIEKLTEYINLYDR